MNKKKNEKKNLEIIKNKQGTSIFKDNRNHYKLIYLNLKNEEEEIIENIMEKLNLNN
jgi:hypothetical protein